MKQDTKQFGIPFNSLKVDGGMTASDIMLQIQADLLQIAVMRPKMVETTALGAAIAAGLQIGFWDDLEHVKHCIASGSSYETFEPAVTERKAAKLKVGWKDAIGRCFKKATNDDVKERAPILAEDGEQWSRSKSMANSQFAAGLLIGAAIVAVAIGVKRRFL